MPRIQPHSGRFHGDRVGTCRLGERKRCKAQDAGTVAVRPVSPLRGKHNTWYDSRAPRAHYAMLARVPVARRARRRWARSPIPLERPSNAAILDAIARPLPAAHPLLRLMLQPLFSSGHPTRVVASLRCGRKSEHRKSPKPAMPYEVVAGHIAVGRLAFLANWTPCFQQQHHLPTMSLALSAVAWVHQNALLQQTRTNQHHRDHQCP
jgi:hypothetical protein